MDRTSYTEPQCLYNGALYLYLYLYSPYGPYGLYRSSVPVQRCTLPLPIPIPLFPLSTVQPVQSLSACTTVHFTFTYTSISPIDRTACTEPQCLYNGALYLYLYLYSSYGPYGMYRASVSVQRCTLPLPIPLLPLWTVQPVQSLSVCTTVHFNFTYTSTPPMDRTACTEPQCVYNGALYLKLPAVKYSIPKYIGQNYSRVLCVNDNIVICFWFCFLCVFQFAIQKFKDYDTQNYNFSSCFEWV